MEPRIRKSAYTLLLLATFAVVGCDNDDLAPATGDYQVATVTGDLVTVVEPGVLSPVFLSSPFCFAPSVFQTGFNLVVRTNRAVVVNGVAFEFLDRFGGHSVPTAILRTSSTTQGFLVPLPLPTSSPIPIPGNVMVPAGSSHTFPFLLQFGCGIPASGTLLVNVNTADLHGVTGMAQTKVAIVGN